MVWSGDADIVYKIKKSLALWLVNLVSSFFSVSNYYISPHLLVRKIYTFIVYVDDFVITSNDSILYNHRDGTFINI